MPRFRRQTERNGRMRIQATCALALLLAHAPAARAIDAQELVAKHIEALGGKAKIDALTSLRLVGKVTFGTGDNSIDLTWTRTAKKPGLVREEGSIQGLTAVYAYDGKEGWSIQPFQGRRDPEHMA